MTQSIIVIDCCLLCYCFQSLPISVLGSIIIVALIPLLKTFADLKQLWHINKADMLTWVVTWLATTVFSIQIGLAVGIAFSLMTVVFDAFTGGSHKMAAMEEGLYKEHDIYESATKSEDRIAVVRTEGPLFFANIDRFKAGILRASVWELESEISTLEDKKANQNVMQANGLKFEHEEATKDGKKEQIPGPDIMAKEITKSEADLKLNALHVESTVSKQTIKANENINHRDTSGSATQDPTRNTPQSDKNTKASKLLILDATAITYVDVQGLNALEQLKIDFVKDGVSLILAGCSESLLQKLDRCGYLELHEKDVFVSVQDAVEANKQRHVYRF